MTYSEAEQYILSFSNLPRTEYMQNPASCTHYLKRVQFFLDLIQNPERKIPHYIHVTGTSGKGSVCAFLHSILLAQKKKTGLFVSPHPTNLCERWQINGRQMSKKEFVQITEKLKPVFDHYAKTSPYDMLSFFDITTIIGLVYFAEKKVEWAVIEVGCGGRYDSTNILPWKDIAIITNIGLDHTQILGETKEKIAYEKSGIIQKNCTVFTMETEKKLLEIIQTECQQKNVILNIVQQQKKDTQKLQEKWNIVGAHQVQNALFCKEIAQFLQIPEKYIEQGIAHTQQTLRMQIISQKPYIILDGAHNRDKIQTTVASTKELQKNKKRKDIHLIVGFSADKTFEQMIKQLSILKPKSIACTRNTINPFRKVANPVDIASLFKKQKIKANIQIFLDPQEAFAWSKKQCKKNDIILSTGSIFLSGELRKIFLSD